MADQSDNRSWRNAPVEWKQGQRDEQATTLGWEQSLSAGPGCTFRVGAGDAAWEQIGKRVLAAAGVEEPDAEELRSTYIEVLSQADSSTARVLGERLGRELAVSEGREVRIPPSGATLAVLEIRFPDVPAVHNFRSRTY